MFCWWQDCPPTLEGPCKDRGPFSPCINMPTGPSSSSSSSSISSSSSSTTTKRTTSFQASSHEMVAVSSITESATSNGENFTDSSPVPDAKDVEYSTENESSNAPTQSPKFCTIMGRNYKVGDKLPHDTGNCVECICGIGAKVTCSPHQCAPAGEDINDYRPPGPRQQTPDVF